MRILGLDPSLSSTGWSIIDGNKVIGAGTFKTKPKHSFLTRLSYIGSFFGGFCGSLNSEGGYQVDCVAVEDVFVNRRNMMTSIKLAKVQGVIIDELFKGFAPELIKIYAPSFVKETVTGSGKADKEQVMKMVKIMTDYKGKSDDESDAIAVALTCERDIQYKKSISKAVDKMLFDL